MEYGCLLGTAREGVSLTQKAVMEYLKETFLFYYYYLLYYFFISSFQDHRNYINVVVTYSGAVGGGMHQDRYG